MTNYQKITLKHVLKNLVQAEKASKTLRESSKLDRQQFLKDLGETRGHINFSVDCLKDILKDLENE